MEEFAQLLLGLYLFGGLNILSPKKKEICFIPVVPAETSLPVDRFTRNTLHSPKHAQNEAEQTCYKVGRVETSLVSKGLPYHKHSNPFFEGKGRFHPLNNTNLLISY